MVNNIGFAKTGIKFEGCDVYIGVRSQMQGERIGPLFKRWMNEVVYRSKTPTPRDVYNVAVDVRRKLLSGEPLFN